MRPFTSNVQKPTNLDRWINLIRSCSRQGLHRETLDHFHRMRGEGHTPDRYVLPSILQACGSLSDLKTGEKLHGLVIRSSFDSDAFVGCALIRMYSKCGRIEYARTMFDVTAERDLAVWNSMVSGYARVGLAKEAMSVFRNMIITGLEPDLVTWNSLISGFSQVGSDEMALHLFRSMRIHGIDPDVSSWTSMVTGFVQNFRIDEAFETFRRMVGVGGVRPNSVTISSLLPACAIAVDARRGKVMHGYALAIGVEEDLFVSSSLIDMYAKCGFISEAGNIFDRMSEKSTVSWNSMIFGYANHGYSDDAIKLFYRMENEGVKADHLTFTAALTACIQAGMVGLGTALFDSMQEEHGIEPRPEHYACLVDLLGRSGQLSEAYDFVKGMPVEPDFFVWGALLGACRNHGNVEIAEVAASHLFELDSERAGSCLAMMNLFADAGRWGDAARMKKVVKKQRLKSYPGCSWIEAA